MSDERAWHPLQENEAIFSLFFSLLATLQVTKLRFRLATN